MTRKDGRVRLAAATWASMVLITVSSGTARSANHQRADAQALDLAKQAIALRSVRGPDNRVPQVAALFKSALVAGGFNDADVTITPVDDTAFLIARWKGRDGSLKPLVISGHMDVVEAKPSDWQRDPFTPVTENGLLYGRGASDMKLDDALAVAALIELKREGFTPRRDIVLAFSGDEETTMKTTAALAKELANAEMVLNVDGTGGQLDPQGKPQYFTWSGAEKTYADFVPIRPMRRRLRSCRRIRPPSARSARPASRRRSTVVTRSTHCRSERVRTSIAAYFPATRARRSWRNCRASPRTRRFSSRMSPRGASPRTLRPCGPM